MSARGLKREIARITHDRNNSRGHERARASARAPRSKFQYNEFRAACNNKAAQWRITRN